MVDVTLITGDGIGPEIAEVMHRCVDATGAGINWEVAEAGADVMDRLGTPLSQPDAEGIVICPESGLWFARRADIVIKKFSRWCSGVWIWMKMPPCRRIKPLGVCPSNN